MLDKKLNEFISLLKSDHGETVNRELVKSDHGETVNRELVKKIVELTDDVSHATIPYWKKVCY